MIIDTFWQLVLALLPTLVNIGITVYIFTRLPKAKTTTVFAYLVIALTLWQTQDVFFRAVKTAEAARIIDQFFCIGWIMAAPLGFHFACSYASLPIVQKRHFIWLTYLPFWLLQRIYVADYDVRLVYDNYWGWITAPGSGMLDGMLRFTVAGLMLLVVFILLHHAYKMRRDKVTRVQAALIATGILIPTLTATITQVAFPVLLSRNEVPVSSLLMSFFSIGTVVALSKYRLFDISESVAVESVLQNLKNIVIVLSPGGRILYQNPFAASLFDNAAGVEQQTDCRQLFASPEAYVAFYDDVLAPALSGQLVMGATTSLCDRNQTRLVIQVNAEALVSNKNVVGVLVVGSDITSHMQMLENLKVANERYHLVSKATNDMVWDWNIGTGEVYRNREGWIKIFREEPQSQFGSAADWEARVHPDDRWRVTDLVQQIETGIIEEVFELELRVAQKDGGIVYLLDRGYVIRDEEGKVVRIIGATQDITLRKEAEQRLQQAQLMRQMEITEAVIRAQENERRLIGAELHDNVNQILTSATLYLGLARSEQNDQARYFDRSEQMIGKAMTEVRKLSHTLIPPTWSGETLIEALDHLLDASEVAGLFGVEKDFDPAAEAVMPFKLKLNIYRIVQEQINNVAKHAQASLLQVRLSQTQGGIELEIADNGIGFDSGSKSKGIGLTNIEARALVHKGHVRIISAPQAGCRLQVFFPASATAPLV